jgi:predicted transposase YdaD
LNTTRNHKSSIFAGYFSDAKKLIELYNAIEGTDYPEDTQVEINTLEDALFRNKINDISFMLDDKLIVLIEQQSSINENMPLRLLMYIGRIYEKIIDPKSIYARTLIKIPKPEFIVLYNGIDSFPEQRTLKLSDAFKDVFTKELLELSVTVYNVNSGCNVDILARCTPLNDYTTFIARIRENEAKGMFIDDAIVESIHYCIANGIMANYLKDHSSEVRNMLFTEYNLEDDKQVSYEEGMTAGMQQGMKQGMQQGKIADALAMKADGMEPTRIAKYTKLSLEDIEKL